MVDYVYVATIFYDTTDVIGVDNSTEAANTTDFEDNYKSSALTVNQIQLLTNSAIIEKTYTQFKALITGDIAWSDIKYTNNHNHYDLYLITNTPL